MAHIQPVILCGGSGNRLWPLSRSGFPKQFLCLTGDDSLFQQAAKRLSVLGVQGDEMSEPIVYEPALNELTFLVHVSLKT